MWYTYQICRQCCSLKPFLLSWCSKKEICRKCLIWHCMLSGAIPFAPTITLLVLILIVLSKSYCTTLCGFQFSYLSASTLCALDIGWEKNIHRLVKLPPHMKSKYVHCKLNRPEPMVELMHCFAKFWTGCCTSRNLLICTCISLDHVSFSAVDSYLRELLAYCIGSMSWGQP